MTSYKAEFGSGATNFYFNGGIEQLRELAPPERSIILTDENVMERHDGLLHHWEAIVIPPGEASKNLQTLDDVVRQLLALKADRRYTLVGVGGGVVTDMAGFVAGIYQRGIRCGFVPTSILAMVDAAIGGKNGLDVGEFKNMIGLVRQPDFLLYDYALLRTLPVLEWRNGFAEIIKHACIGDAEMFASLAQHELADYRQNITLLDELIQRNAQQKIAVVLQDETETGLRRTLNYGHTLAHAIENVMGYPHGFAVSIGMVFAAKMSEAITGFPGLEQIKNLLEKYGLPTDGNYDKKEALQLMMSDKKRQGNIINYVLLEQIGKAVIEPLEAAQIQTFLST
ncbi:MAG: 3-dehydroquinate synthase [Edaphocola sp.]